MHTFTFQDGVLTPGFDVRQYQGQWVLEFDSGIELNQANLPQIQNGTIVSASVGDKRRFMRTHHVLQAAHATRHTSVLVLLRDLVYAADGTPYPTALGGREWKIVQLKRGSEFCFQDESRIVLESDTPEYLTWRQYALYKASRTKLTHGVPVLCARLIERNPYAMPDGVLSPEFMSGLHITPDTNLGAAVVIGTPEQPEWLPVLGALPEGSSDVNGALLTLLGERTILSEADTQEPGKRVRLFGLTPYQLTGPPEAWLVLANSHFFCNPNVVSGRPDMIQSERETVHLHTKRPANENVLLVLHEGDAVAYTHSNSSLSDETSNVVYVQNNQLHCTSYTRWRISDMSANPDHYLVQRHAPEAVLEQLPPNWVGARMEIVLKAKRVVGELIQVTGDKVLLKTEWGHGCHPSIVQLQPLWLVYKGESFRCWPPELQIDAFQKAGIWHAVFKSRTSIEKLRTPDFEGTIAPVAIIEVSAHPLTGEIVLAYGGPYLAEGPSHRKLFLSHAWYDTYQKAEEARNALIAALRAGMTPELSEACHYRLKFEQDTIGQTPQ